ncbi:hypothetical protein M0805_005739 [Coniferiporia weirii]|nr:hypothetical protein M0805_005739 [Coniferiporia weirii]
MSAYKTFAVAGAGTLGSFIVEELLKLKNAGIIESVIILTRSDGSHERLVAKGAQTAVVDYTSPSSLESALASVDALICAFCFSAYALQKDLATAAKAAGVQLFVPSEFGNASQGRQDPIAKLKDSIRRRLMVIDLPSAIFYTGAFPDHMFTPRIAKMLGFDLINGKAVVGGSGDAPASFTGRADIARYLAHVLTVLPRSEIEWKTFRIEGERSTLNKVLAELQERTCRNIEISYRNRGELERALRTNPTDILSAIWLDWDMGGMVIGNAGELSNHLWPEWKPAKAVEYVIQTAERCY